MKYVTGASTFHGSQVPPIRAANRQESIPEYLERCEGGFDLTRYRQILGAANEYKEGDDATGVAAADEASRTAARTLLANTRVGWLVAHSVFEDALSEWIRGAVDDAVTDKLLDWTMAELNNFLLSAPESDIQAIIPGLPSDLIACVVKLMSNAELIAAGSRIFHPLPGSQIGARGYMGARIQPNSPTDNIEDIQWQVFNGFSYAVGDVVLGTNPVSGDVESVAAVEKALADIVRTFGLEEILPHCVLAHIDAQAEAERRYPGCTALWFQSLAGVADANATFDISVEKMAKHAAARTGRFGMYFETGQGADATNGHGKCFDIVIHESRKYGFARALKREIAEAQLRAGRQPEPWVHVNDVAGFIGPEVFRTREQLVRCCLEDIVMGKLHGLTIGLDICATLHMDIDPGDLDWCIDQVMPANPAYLMALPTKNDPMLSYLTTGFQDHLRVREKFGYKVNDAMWKFFHQLGVIDAAGRPAENFGRPDGVYLRYRRRKGDTRSESDILAEAAQKMREIRARGVELTEGHGAEMWNLQPETASRLRRLYLDARESLWAELPADFESRLANAIAIQTLATDREDYMLHPPRGEQLAPASREKLLAVTHQAREVQIVISDGLNALALTDPGHLEPYLEALRANFEGVSPISVVVRNGRVRAGYRIGETLFGGISDRKAVRTIIHIIGERPGSGHHAYSVYLTAATAGDWADPGRVDHNLTRVISGISDTSLSPERAALETVALVSAQVKALLHL